MIRSTPPTRRPGARRIQREARLLLVELKGRSAALEHADGSLIRACVAFAVPQGGTTPTRTARILRSVAASRATTMDGHRARAAAFILWDEGDLLERACVDGILEEVLLRAILIDLVLGPP